MYCVLTFGVLDGRQHDNNVCAALHVVCCCVVPFNTSQNEEVVVVLAGIYRQYSTLYGTANGAAQHNTIQRSVEVSTPHTPHAESAIRHVKNKAHSMALNLPYALLTRWIGALLTFVVRTINMVTRSNAPHHMSAYIRPSRAVQPYTIIRQACTVCIRHCLLPTEIFLTLQKPRTVPWRLLRVAQCI
jgi:hypothetical protein